MPARLFENRSRERFRREVLCHLDAAYNLAQWLVRHADDAEDIVQDSVVRAMKAYGGLRSDEPKAWLLSIVRNACMSHLKAKNRRQELEIPEEEPVDPSADSRPDAALERSFDSERLRAAIDGLPAAWRELIVLREFEQMSYKDLASVTGCPIGTVMSRLARARSRLLEVLSQEAL